MLAAAYCLDEGGPGQGSLFPMQDRQRAHVRQRSEHRWPPHQPSLGSLTRQQHLLRSVRLPLVDYPEIRWGRVYTKAGECKTSRGQQKEKEKFEKIFLELVVSVLIQALVCSPTNVEFIQLSTKQIKEPK